MERRLVRTAARLGWLVPTLALAAALVAGSWANYRAVRAAVAPLNRGQVQLISAALREEFHPWNAVDAAALRRFLDANAATGVRYVALYDPGLPVLSAGEPADGGAPGGGDSLAGAPELLVDLGGRLRATLPRPPRGARTQQGGPGGPGGVRGEGGPPGPDRGPQSYTLVEFEPVVASALVSRARSSLALACAGAAILTLAALVFWRSSARYERARLRLEEQKRLTQLGEMSAVMAHEIRNPLASLKGNAQLLAERLEEGTRERRRADRVVGEATRLEALTADLLDFARTGPIDRRPADPAALLRAAADEATGGAAEVDAGAAPERWPLDAARIRQALVNLLRNAAQVTPAGRPPVARVAREGGGLVFTVRDFGPGLAAGERERIFDPFYTTRTTGTGLGLPVARRVAEMHGGTLDADNHPDGGAVFRIVLPP